MLVTYYFDTFPLNKYWNEYCMEELYVSVDWDVTYFGINL